MSLRLLWAGPWNRRSAIGLFGTEVVGALVGKGHQVDVLRTELGSDLLLPAYPAPGSDPAVRCNADSRAIAGL